MIDIDERMIVSFLRSGLAGLEVAYLFGSSVGDSVASPGDIDIAVLARRPLDALLRWKLQERLANVLHVDVDLVDLRSASTVLRMQVVANGRVLYESDPIGRERFEDTVFSAYARLNESRRELLQEVITRGKVYA